MRIDAGIHFSSLPTLVPDETSDMSDDNDSTRDAGACSMSAFLAFALLALSPDRTIAADGAASRQPTDIPAQAMDPALRTLAKEMDFQILYRSDVVDNAHSAGAKGDLNADEALKLLLSGTGLTYRYLGEKAVTIFPASETANLRLTQAAPANSGAPVSIATDAPESDTPDTNTGDPQALTLEEVLVTAQKRIERLGDVPLSITALNEQTLERLGAQDIDDFVRNVPNLSIEPTIVGASFIQIRGISSTAGSPTVGVYIDETPIQIYQRGFSGNPNPKVFDLDRIEVLRGPQGTLYGASSMGGTLRYITKQPDLRDFSARLLTEVASTKGGDPSWQVAAAAGGPISEGRVGFRASAYYRNDGGYVDNYDRDTGAVAHRNINETRTVALRGALTAKLSDSFDATLSSFYQQSERDDLPVFERPSGPFSQGFQVEQPGRDHFILPSLKINGEFGPVTLTSVSSLLRRTDSQQADYSTTISELLLIPALGPQFTGVEPVGGEINQASTEQRAFSQEIRLASYDPDARLRWVVGGFYQNSSVRLLQTVVEPGLEDLFQSIFGAGVEAIAGLPLLPGDLSYLGREQVDEEQAAVFGELMFKLTPQVELIAGARRSDVKTVIRVAADGFFNGGPTSATGAAPRRQNETPFTPRLGVNFRPGANQLFYATASRGFRSGAGNLPVPAAPCAADLAALGIGEAPPTYSSDTTQNYELGYKGTLADQRLSMSAALFRVDWTDIQQSVYLPSCGFGFIGNLGKARSQGFELELQAQPLRGLLLTGALGYAHSQYTKTISLGSGAAVTTDGDRVPFAPQWTATAGVEQRLSLATRPAYVRVDYQYRGNLTRSSSGAEVAGNPFLFRQSSYNYLSARSGIRFGKWDVALFIENLLDDRPLLHRSNVLNPTTNLHVRELTLQPRTIGLNLSLDF